MRWTSPLLLCSSSLPPKELVLCFASGPNRPQYVLCGARRLSGQKGQGERNRDSRDVHGRVFFEHAVLSFWCAGCVHLLLGSDFHPDGPVGCLLSYTPARSLIAQNEGEIMYTYDQKYIAKQHYQFSDQKEAGAPTRLLKPAIS